MANQFGYQLILNTYPSLRGQSEIQQLKAIKQTLKNKEQLKDIIHRLLKKKCFSILKQLIVHYNIKSYQIEESLIDSFLAANQWELLDLVARNSRICPTKNPAKLAKLNASTSSMMVHMGKYLNNSQKIIEREDQFKFLQLQNLEMLCGMYLREFNQPHIQQHGVPIYDQKVVEIAVAQNQILVIQAIWHDNKKKLCKFLQRQDILQTILRQLVKSETFNNGIYMLHKACYKPPAAEQMEEVADFFGDRITQQAESDLFTKCIQITVSPIVTLLTISKILYKFALKNAPMSDKFLKLGGMYQSLATKYRNEVLDRGEIEAVLCTNVFPLEKSLLKVFSKDKYAQLFREFLNDDRICSILQQKWISVKSCDYNLFAGSTAFNYLSNKNFPKIKTIPNSALNQATIFQNIRPADHPALLKNKYFFYQFKFFQRSTQIKQALEFIYNVIMLVLIYATLLHTYQPIFHKLDAVDRDFANLAMYNWTPPPYKSTWTCATTVAPGTDTGTQAPEKRNRAYPSSLILAISDMQTLCLGYLMQRTCSASAAAAVVQQYQKDCYLFLYYTNKNVKMLLLESILVAILIIYLIQFLAEKIYVYQAWRKFKITFTDVLNLSISILSIAYFHIAFQNLYLNKLQYAYKSYEDIMDAVRVDQLLVFIILALLYVKLFVFLGKLKVIGVQVKAITEIVCRILKYLLIIGVVVVVSASMFYIIFNYESTSYASFYESLLRLVEASQSLFQLTEKETHQSWVMITFLFIVNVLLLNVLIAVIIYNFKTIQKRARLEFSLMLYADYQQKKFSKLYSAILAYPPPLTVLNIFLLPLLLVLKKQSLNRVCCIISFTLILLPLYLAALVCVNCFVLIPLAYLRMFGMIYSIENKLRLTHKSGVKRMVRLTYNSLLWLVGGLAWHLVVFILKDIPAFISSCYNEQHLEHDLMKTNIYKYYLFYPAVYEEYFLGQSDESLVEHLVFNLQQKQNIKESDLLDSQCKQQQSIKNKTVQYNQLLSPKAMAQECISEQSFFALTVQQRSQNQLSKQIQLLKQKFIYHCAPSDAPSRSRSIATVLKQLFISLTSFEQNRVRAKHALYLFNITVNRKPRLVRDTADERLLLCKSPTGSEKDKMTYSELKMSDRVRTYEASFRGDGLKLDIDSPKKI